MQFGRNLFQVRLGVREKEVYCSHEGFTRLLWRLHISSLHLVCPIIIIHSFQVIAIVKHEQWQLWVLYSLFSNIWNCVLQWMIGWPLIWPCHKARNAAIGLHADLKICINMQIHDKWHFIVLHMQSLCLNIHFYGMPIKLSTQPQLGNKREAILETNSKLVILYGTDVQKVLLHALYTIHWWHMRVGFIFLHHQGS